MTHKQLFHAGLFCMKEAVYNVLLEASEAGSPEMGNKEISEILGTGRSYQETAPDYVLLHGALDELCREGRVERVPARKMIWRIIS